MGANVQAAGSKGGRRRRRGAPRYGAMAEINMTPFIDVMLVLLIIFMVAAPLLATGVPIDLPQTKAAPLNVDQKPVAVAIDDKGAVYLLDKPCAPEQLAERLAQSTPHGFEERIYIRGAKGVSYGRVAEIMSLVTAAGYKKVALVTEPENR
jgi:biopolymer transport protein TolR